MRLPDSPFRVGSMLAGAAVVLLAAATGSTQAVDLAALEHSVAARPDDVAAHRKLASAYEAAGRLLDAVAAWRKVTALAPTSAGAWYALGQAYTSVAREAMRSFDDDRPAHAPWRQLLVADRLAATGHFTDAFAMYRSVLNELPSMTSIHESVARVYERTGHPDWAIRERRLGVVPPDECGVRPALCEFRAGRYDAVLRATLAATDSESRYWRARAATELALAAFARLDTLPDSPERHATRAATARAEDRHQHAIAEWAAALKLAPGSPALVYEFASSHYAARNFEQTVATLAPLLQANPADVRLLKLTGYALVHLRKVDEAVPVLERAIALDPSDSGAQLALGRAHVHRGAFAAAIPLIEPHLAADQDGSLHVQLARAYAGIGQRERSDALLARSQELHRASEERSAAAVRRRIAPPK